MRIYSILAHPRTDSFCHAIAAAAHEELCKLGHTLNYHDLYAEDFDPVLKAEEAYTVGEDVEAVLAKATDPVVQAHRQEIEQAEGLLVIHPNWWGKPPAILAGWLDRVLVPGVAYRLEAGEGEPEGLLGIRKALILNTSDTPAERENTILGDPLQSIWTRCVLPFCGVETTNRHIFRPVAGSTSQQRAAWLQTASSLAGEFFGPSKAST